MKVRSKRSIPLIFITSFFGKSPLKTKEEKVAFVIERMKVLAEINKGIEEFNEKIKAQNY